MQLSDLLSPDRVAAGTGIGSKKRALERLSELLASADPALTAGEVFDMLLNRERLGGTGLGHGVAIPHGRLKNNALTVGAFLKLDRGVDFDAQDQEPVDLLFALLVPEQSTEAHLQILSLLASMFSDEQFRDQLRHAESEQALYELLMHRAAPNP